MSDDKTPESAEVAMHIYRRAQANRVLRYCQSHGIDEARMMAGEFDLTPILDDEGHIRPEREDIIAARSEAQSG